MYKISPANLSIFFTAILFFDALDFMYFDSRSTLGSIFSVLFIFRLIVLKTINFVYKIALAQVVIFASLLMNGSIISSPLKSVYFLVTMAALTLVLFSGDKVILNLNKAHNFVNNSLSNCVLFLAFFILSIDSLTYHFGLRDFLMNPNQLGIWSATYLAFGFFINRNFDQRFVPRSILCVAFFALIASGSKGAIFMIFLPAVVFLIGKANPKVIGVTSLGYLICFMFFYGDISSIENHARLLVEFKQKFIGGSEEYSDMLRLIEIPLLVLSQLTDLNKVFFGVGVHYTLNDGLYQQIIPHNAFFMLVSNIGVLGALVINMLILVSIFFSRSRSASALIATCLFYVAITGSPHISRGPIYPLVLLLLVTLLTSSELSNRRKKGEICIC